MGAAERATGVRMDIFGDTDIQGTWLQHLFSRFGLMIIAIAVASALLENLTRGRRRTRGARAHFPNEGRTPRWTRLNLRPEADREAEPLLRAGANPALDEILRLSPGGFEEFVADHGSSRRHQPEARGGTTRE